MRGRVTSIALALLFLVARPAPAQDVPADATPRLREIQESLRVYQIEANHRRITLSNQLRVHVLVVKAYAELPEGGRGANAPRSIASIEEAERLAEELGVDRNPIVATALGNLKELVTRFVPFQSPEESKRRFFDYTVPFTELLIEGAEQLYREGMLARSLEESLVNLSRMGRTASTSVEKNLLDWEKLLARKPVD